MNELQLTERRDGIRIGVRVQPRASRDALVGVHAGALKVALTAPPVGGQANGALVALLAKRLGIPKKRVRIVSGDTSRQKVVEVRGLDAATLRARLTDAGG